MCDIEERMELLLQQAGRKFVPLNEDGTYQGCFYPLQFVYPDKPRFKVDTDNVEENYIFGIQKLAENGREITKDELRTGDVAAMKVNGHLHIGLYWKNGKIVHVFEKSALQINRMRFFERFETRYYRMEE